MKNNDAADLQAIKTFYGPHPGHAGAAIPIPAAVKKAADELDGQTLTLGEAVRRLRAATTGTIKIDPKGNCIFLLLEGSGEYAGHIFRVISYR